MRLKSYLLNHRITFISLIFCVFSVLIGCVEIYQMRQCEVVPDGTESFIYFTDPHLSRTSQKNIDRTFNLLKMYAKEYGYNFCICGGDWLVNNETYAEACDALRYIHKSADIAFGDNYYPVLGNHDTNYQGRKDECSSKNTGQLQDADIHDLMFNRFGRAYYEFETDETLWIVLDSGIDWETEMSQYRWEQIDWLGSKLQSDSKKHVVICIHIFSNYDSKGTLVIQKLAKNAMDLSLAYNSRLKKEFNGIVYDFTDTSGSVACFLCGHNHADYVMESLGIPVICTRRFETDGIKSFDLCTFDWDNGQLAIKRVGEGSDRVVNIITG